MVEYKNIIKQAPLPFLGNKRNWMRPLYEYYNNKRLPSTIVDVFGGSGLCANFFKQISPSSRVIWNDYDNYQERLSHIEDTNIILSKIREYISNHSEEELYYPETINKRAPKFLLEHKENMRNIILSHDYVDYTTINVWFSLLGQRCRGSLPNGYWYNKMPLKDYNANGYLSNVERVSKDFRTLMLEFENSEDVLFILDPPYIKTSMGEYVQAQTVKDFFDLFSMMEKTRHSFITFTSSTSLLSPIIDYFYPELTGFCDEKLVKKQTSSAVKQWDEIAYIKNRG